MKSALLLILFLFSFHQTVPVETEHLGSFDVYMINNKVIEVHYRGKLNKCIALYLIKKLEQECEAVDESVLDSVYQFEPKIDTIKISRI